MSSSSLLLRGKASGCGSIVPRFTTGAVAGKGCRWLLPTGWNDEQKARFCALRQAPPCGLYAPVPHVEARRRAPPALVGRWLLELDGDPSTGAAVEAQALVTNFCTVHLLVSRCSASDGWRGPQAQAALSLMVSGLLLMTRADVLLVIPLEAEAGRELADLGWGAMRRLWSPLAFDAVHPRSAATALPPQAGLSVPSVAIDVGDWWESERGRTDRATLSYLEKRVEVEAAKARPPRPRPRRVLDLLNGLLRWR